MYVTATAISRGLQVLIVYFRMLGAVSFETKTFHKNHLRIYIYIYGTKFEMCRVIKISGCMCSKRISFDRIR